MPTQLVALREALEAPGAERFDLSSLRFVFGAGAAVPVDLIRAFERHGLVLQQGFGQTETSILCCLDARDAVRKAGSVGRPGLARRAARGDARRASSASRRDWVDAADGETGEIVVRGPITMLGYWKRPEATAQTIRGEWLRTGDLATRDDEGFLTLVGRARDMYISGGENVYPAEVEARLPRAPRRARDRGGGRARRAWGEVGSRLRRACATARGSTPRRCAPGAASASRASSSRSDSWRWPSCRAPRPARCRSTGSRNGPGRSGGWARTNDLRLMKPPL